MQVSSEGLEEINLKAICSRRFQLVMTQDDEPD